MNALHVATLSGWRRFESDGGAWRDAGRGLMYWSLTCLSVDPENPAVLYAGSEHSGLFYTTDGGKRWLRASPNVPKLMLFSLLALPGTVLAGTVPAALYRKTGGGWEEIEGVRLASSGATFPPSPELQSRTRYLAFDPRDYKRLYAGIEVGGLLMSDNGGKNWRAAGKTLTDPDVHEVLASKNDGLLLAACGDKAFRSRDRGESWEDITPARDYGMSVAEDNDGYVYLGSARGRPNTWLRESGADAAIYRSRSAGGDWEPAISGLGGGVMSMCAAPDGHGVIAGTSNGELIAVEGKGARIVAAGLPCITAVAAGA